MQAVSLKQSYANTCLWVALAEWLLDFYKSREECFSISLKLFEIINQKIITDLHQLPLQALVKKIHKNIKYLKIHLNGEELDAPWEQIWGQTMEYLFALAPISDDSFHPSQKFPLLVKKNTFFNSLWPFKNLHFFNETSDASSKTVLQLLEKITGVKFLFLLFKNNEIEHCTQKQIENLYHLLEQNGSIIIMSQHAMYYKKIESHIKRWDPETGRSNLIDKAECMEALAKLDTTWIVPQI